MNNSEKLDLILKTVINIDKRLTSVENRLTSVKNKLTSVENRLTSVEKSVSLLNKRVDYIELRLENVENKIINNNKRIEKIKKNNIEELVKYRKRNNKIIENETTKSVLHKLIETYPATFFIDVSTRFPTKIKNEQNRQIIQIDGLILGTNDIEFAKKYDKNIMLLYNKIYKNNTKEKNNLFYELYIIEGKHNITKNKVIEKYSKYLKFKDFLNKIRTTPKEELNRFSKMCIDDFKFNLISPTNVKLIFGTPSWQTDALDELNKIMKTDNNVMKIEISGNRYQIHNI